MLVEKIKSKININENKKNVAKISFGTLGGQAISFITLPVLTRIYGANVIGTWTLFNSIAIIINSFSDLGLSNAIMLEKDEENMKRAYKVITTIVMMFSIIGSVFILLYYSLINTEGSLNKYFIFIFIFASIFTLQQIQVCYTWLNRKSEYKILMKNPIINNGIFGVIAIGFGFCGWISYGYFVGWILGQVITLLHMKRFLPKGMFTFCKSDYIYVLGKYFNFLKYQLPTNVVSNIKNQIPIFGIRLFFGESILGYYSIVVKIMQIPINLLASAMGRVFFQTASDMKRRGQEIGNYVYNNITNVTKVAAIPLIIVIAMGDYLAVIFLGNEWIVAGNFMRILVFQNFFMFLMSSVQGIAITLDKQRLAMVFCFLQSFGFIVGLSIGKYIFNDSYMGLAFMSLAYVICNIIYFCMLFKSMEIDPKKYLKSVLSCLFIMTIFSICIRIIITTGFNYFGIII